MQVPAHADGDLAALAATSDTRASQTVGDLADTPLADRYALGEEIARGGMGAVFRA